MLMDSWQEQCSLGLSNRYQGVAFHDSIALVDIDACDGARSLSLDVVLHLHGFENHYGISCAHLVAHLYFNVVDGARQWSYHRLATSAC